MIKRPQSDLELSKAKQMMTWLLLIPKHAKICKTMIDFLGDFLMKKRKCFTLTNNDLNVTLMP